MQEVGPPMRRSQRTLGSFIFLSRWLQAPLYCGLIVAQCVYVYRFIIELFHLIQLAPKIAETEIMLTVLGLIDVVMIANLLIMVIVGGYETFVSRLNLQDHPDQPEWLSHVNAGVAQSEARDGANWHLVDSLAEDFHRGRAAIEQGDPLANRHSSHICCLRIHARLDRSDHDE